MSDPKYFGRASYFDSGLQQWVLSDHPPEEGWWRSGKVWKPPDVSPSWANRVGWWWARRSSWSQAFIVTGIVMAVIALIGVGSLLNPQPRRDRAAERAVALSSGITPGEFNRIEPGMTYDQVEAIVDEPGELVGQSSIGASDSAIYEWPGWSGSGAATVVFRDGVVSSKAQFGL